MKNNTKSVTDAQTKANESISWFLTVRILDQIGLDCAVFTSPPTQYRLYGRRFLQVKRPNQQYQSTEGNATKDKSNNGNNTNTHAETIIETNNDIHT